MIPTLGSSFQNNTLNLDRISSRPFFGGNRYTTADRSRITPIKRVMNLTLANLLVF